jgi:anti-anti-sigma factor
MENTVQSEQAVQEKKTNTVDTNNNPGQSPSDVQVTPTGEITTSGDQGENNAPAGAQAPLPENVRQQLEAEKKISTNVMSICLTSDGLVIKDEEREEQDELAAKLSGVYCEGVQYYDLNGITYINNTGMAILIDLLKALLEMKVEVQFVNVHDSIKKKIREMGLENIINIGDSAT